MIAILGGTFDPIHLGHLHIAKQLLQLPTIQQIRFLPCFEPVHRGTPIASPEHRLAMLKLALENEPKLTVDETEMQRQGKSYLIDTLKELRKKNTTPLAFILGVDSFSTIDTWKDWKHLIDYCHFIVVNRQGSDLSVNEDLTPSIWKTRIQKNIENLSHKPSGLIYFAQITTSPISATLIRTKLRENADISHDLPENVSNYIKKHQLYGCHPEQSEGPT